MSDYGPSDYRASLGYRAYLAEEESSYTVNGRWVYVMNRINNPDKYLRYDFVKMVTGHLEAAGLGNEFLMNPVLEQLTVHAWQKDVDPLHALHQAIPVSLRTIDRESIVRLVNFVANQLVTGLRPKTEGRQHGAIR